MWDTYFFNIGRDVVAGIFVNLDEREKSFRPECFQVCFTCNPHGVLVARRDRIVAVRRPHLAVDFRLVDRLLVLLKLCSHALDRNAGTHL